MIVGNSCYKSSMKLDKYLVGQLSSLTVDSGTKMSLETSKFNDMMTSLIIFFSENNSLKFQDNITYLACKVGMYT